MELNARRRFIETAFPLRQVSLDSGHEKNVRHGHVSTLHIWPARRPLAANHAALLATLLPDPGTAGDLRELLGRMAGQIVEVPSSSNDRMKEETRGGILHWGRESEEEGAAEIGNFREEIRNAFGRRAPRILDPFAGGGAIPREATWLGCEAVAADLNRVAWFILRCTLHYPHRLARQARALPEFALRDQGYAERLLKAQGVTGKKALRDELARLGHGDGEPTQVDSLRTGDDRVPASGADLAWHLRAWGQRVLDEVRRELAARYPTYAEFEPVRRKGRRRAEARPSEVRHRPRPTRLLVPDEHGHVSTRSLNAEFNSLYLENDANPRWIAKPPVAYLWARTVRCSGCRAVLPLLKTRWLCRKEKKRVLLKLQPREDDTVIDLGIEHEVPEGSGSTSQKRECVRTLGAGTMSGSGAACPCCGAVATMEDLRIEDRAGRLGLRMTAVVVDGQEGKEYRLPTEAEIEAACVTEEELDRLYGEIPFGLPDDPTPSQQSLGIRIPRYGFNKWRNLFVWLRRVLHGFSPKTDAVFTETLGPKWDHEKGDGELIDDASRFGGAREASKRNYEDGVARAFSCFHEVLRDDGRLVIVFANKQPDAWETLVSALTRAGFVVDGSWPIQTERQSRQRSLASAALSSSIWLVCKKRPASARPGWDARVLAEMQENITGRLHDFWDAGIRGPDFVWAATGPALEAFSRHPVVRKADAPGERLTVAEFLRRVRRMVVGFVVSRLLAQDSGAEGELDDPTTYYLLHRSDFGLRPAPAGACILYALSCNLSDADLVGRLDLLARGGRTTPMADDEEAAEQERESSGSEVRFKPWNRRRARNLGEPSPDGSPPPLIDCVHKLVQLWKTGQQSRVDAYLEARGLWRHELFARVVQALIELAEGGSEERTTLESIQNHIGARGGGAAPWQETLQLGESS